MRNDFLKFLFSVFLLLGTIIGAGFFSLPYLLVQVGWKVFLAEFFILLFLVILVHLLFAEVSLKTPDEKRLVGFVKTHLGKSWEKFSFFVTILGLLGGELVYLILGGKLLKNIFSPFLNFDENLWGLFYFLAGFFLIYFDIRPISFFEFFATFLFLFSFFGIFLKNYLHFSLENFFFQPKNFSLFLPYGPILFSFWGLSLIPEIEEFLRPKKKLISKVVVFSILISAIFYLFFTFSVIAISGQNVDPFSLLSLKDCLSELDFKYLLFLGVLTTFTSFVAFGLTFKKVLWYDLKISQKKAFFVGSFLPLFLYFLGIKNFIKVISFLGSVGLGLEAILILLIYKKIGKAKFLVFPLILVFIVGIFAEFWNFLK